MTSKQDIPSEAIQGLRVVQDVLGESVVAAYLFGSALAGGLRATSDVDVLVIVDRGLPALVRSRLVADLLHVSGPVGNDGGRRPLELTIVCQSDVVPWHYPPKNQLVYGEWLRDEFEQGRISAPGPDPDLAIVLKKVRDNSLPLLGPTASVTLDRVPMADVRRAIKDSLPEVIEGIGGDERNALLTLARMWLTARQGVIAPKDAAAAWAMARLDEDNGFLLDLARRGYLGHCEDSWTGKQAELEALMATMKQAIEASLAEES